MDACIQPVGDASWPGFRHPSSWVERSAPNFVLSTPVEKPVEIDGKTTKIDPKGTPISGVPKLLIKATEKSFLTK